MQTSWFTDTLQADLEAVGSLGSEKAARVAERLIAVTIPLAKARMLEAFSLAANELADALDVDGVDLRVNGDEVTFVASERHEPPVPPRPADGGSEQARFSLRLPDDLKARIDERASADGVSTNTWIVRALEGSLGRAPRNAPGRRLSGFGRS
jgi:hypothetical protein